MAKEISISISKLVYTRTIRKICFHVASKVKISRNIKEDRSSPTLSVNTATISCFKSYLRGETTLFTNFDRPSKYLRRLKFALKKGCTPLHRLLSTRVASRIFKKKQIPWSKSNKLIEKATNLLNKFNMLIWLIKNMYLLTYF